MIQLSDSFLFVRDIRDLFFIHNSCYRAVWSLSLGFCFYFNFHSSGCNTTAFCFLSLSHNQARKQALSIIINILLIIMRMFLDFVIKLLNKNLVMLPILFCKHFRKYRFSGKYFKFQKILIIFILFYWKEIYFLVNKN